MPGDKLAAVIDLAMPWVNIGLINGLTGLSAAGGSPSATYAVAATLLVAGLLCQLLHRRLPAALGTTLFVSTVTAAVVVLALGRDWSVSSSIHLASRTASILSALWAMLGWLTSGRVSRTDRRSLSPPSSVFFAWSLVCGLAAAVAVLFVLVFATWSRLLDPDSLIEKLTSEGAIDLLAIVVAALFWVAAVARPQQPAMLLTLLAVLAWWSSLMIPSGVGSLELANRSTSDGNGGLLAFQSAWWTWTFQMQFGLAVLLVGAAVLQDLRFRARRRRAWPDRLDDLLEPYSRWPAYIRVEAVIAAVILILGVYQIVRPYPTAWQLSLANFLVALAAGLTCLFMSYRRWSGNTAGLGIALMTLAAVALADLIAAAFMPPDSADDYTRRIPILDNAVLFALAAAIPYWSWLARFWDQQLLNGRPWTTAGRMIPFAGRAAFLLAALAVLVAFRMALWPRQIQANVEDASWGRLSAGLAAIAVLAAITAAKARRHDSTSEATLSVAFLIAAAVFAFIRMPPAQRQTWGWLIQYETILLSATCLPLLLIADALGKTRWRSFSLPLWLLALLVLPMRAIILVLPSMRLPAAWVRPVTLAFLGVAFFAGGSRSRRAFLVLGGVLMLVAAWTFYRSYGEVIIR